MKTQGLKKRMAVMLILIGGWHMTARPEVIITGILDGTLTGGCPKAIEIFVTGTENLNYYEIWRSLNGAPFGEGTGAISSLFGVYTNTFVYLVKTDHVNAFHDVFGDEGIYANVFPMGIISGNGNDGFQLRQKVGSVVIDQVWLEDATDSYRDSYWYRKHGTGPDGGWLQSAWETPGNDALDGLDEAGLQAAVPFGTYANLWTGLSADWNDAANWSLGIVPSPQTNVLIRETTSTFPVISNLPESPACCMNLTVADTARLTVLAGKALTVYGDLYLESQDPGTTARGLILKSETNSTRTGSLLLKGNPTGTVTLERYLAKDNGWHLLSSPVAGQNFQPAFVPDPIDQTFDLYYWDENSLPSEGWINIRDENGQWNPQFENSFSAGKGYLAAYAPSNPGELTRTFSGLLHSGDQDIPLSHSGNYWNLLGNPYACALNWSSAGIDKGVVAASTMYVWDPSLNDNLGGYRAHNGETGVPEGTTPLIPAMQGFFVHSLSTGFLAVDLSNDEPLAHGDQAFYKSTNELSVQRIRLKISKDHYADETLIYFNPAASNEFDPGFDAEKLFNDKSGCPEIFSRASPDHSLCINILADYPVSVPLGVSFSTEDSLSITAFDFEGLSPETGIFLEDKLASSWINFREQTEYRFIHKPLHTGSRLLLHLTDVAHQLEPVQKPGLEFWNSGSRVYISNEFSTEGEIYLLSLDGRCLFSNRLPAGNSIFQMPFPAGLYILRISTNSGNFNRKIFIN
jgi:hypothetical protein